MLRIAVLFVAVSSGIAFAADMEVVYSQKTGAVTLNGKNIGKGYSGNGEGLNNPEKEAVENVGPIPAGEYEIGKAEKHKTKGPIVMRLTPVGHDAHKRTAFLIHGDNQQNNKSASEGCLILGPSIRKQIADSGVTKLVVVK